MDSIPPLKRCTKCSETKPLSAFSLYKGSPRRQCRSCMQVYNRAYYERNTNKAKAEAKKWRESHPEREKANQQRHYAENKEYYAQKARGWYTANRDRSLARSSVYHRTETGKIRRRLIESKYRSRRKQGDVTVEEINRLMQRQTHCAYCKKKFSTAIPSTIDHVIPLSKGGLHTISNLVLACRSCNSRKHNNEIYLI